ncbi:hypothetical protein EYF80_011917 [Liparis tanakae]|uniref:Uncharacterized protein n=1 Tax=Liparis tanakae TaxID=230148 RepID=A0A4Z2IIM2_9TELE|nr:hypothetical protein EYF80_011917 [Liparis tanakae]
MWAFSGKGLMLPAGRRNSFVDTSSRGCMLEDLSWSWRFQPDYLLPYEELSGALRTRPTAVALRSIP